MKRGIAPHRYFCRRENRNRAWEQAKAYLDEHVQENGTLSAEDAQVFDQMEGEVVALGHQIERLERREAMDAELSRPVTSPLISKPGAGVDTKTGRASDAYRKAFIAGLRTRFNSVSDVLSTGIDPNGGGYLVPEDLDNRLIVIQVPDLIRFHAYEKSDSLMRTAMTSSYYCPFSRQM